MGYSLAVGKVFLCSLLVIQSFKTVACSGRFGIRLISYDDFHGKDKDGKCCDGFFQNSTKLCKPCDHFIFSCLLNARDHGKGPCVSNNVSTETVNKSNSITFGNSSGTYPNPFELRFNVSSMVIPELVFNIYDDDRLDIPPSKSELLEKISFVVYLITADNFTSTPQLQIGNITSNKSRLEFEYWFQCDQNYYSSSVMSKCDAFCKSDPLRYECSTSGSRQCHKEWIGSDCLTYNYCFNITCLHGGKCRNGASRFTCQCGSKYTGTMCETDVTSTTATSQHMLSTKSSTTRTVSTSPSRSSPPTKSSTIRTVIPTSSITIPSSPALSTTRLSTTRTVLPTSSSALPLSSTLLTNKLSSSITVSSFNLSASATKSATKLSYPSQNMVGNYSTPQGPVSTATWTSNKDLTLITFSQSSVTTTSSRNSATHANLSRKKDEEKQTFPNDVWVGNVWIFLGAVAGGITLLGIGASIVMYKKNRIGNTAAQDDSTAKTIDW